MNQVLDELCDERNEILDKFEAEMNDMGLSYMNKSEQKSKYHNSCILTLDYALSTHSEAEFLGEPRSRIT